MKVLKIATVMFCGALFWATLSTNVKANEFNEKTIETFSAPVEVPGEVLSAN